MLAVLIPKPNASQRVSYDSHGYVRQNAGGSNDVGLEGLKLQNIKSLTVSRKNPSSEFYWRDTHDDREELPELPAAVQTTTVTEPDEELVGPNDARRLNPRNVLQLRRMR
jgi:hypothetical protein